MDTNIADFAPPKHNRPPIREVLRERTDDIPTSLAVEGAGLIARRDELLAAAGRVPTAIADDDVAGKVADQVKQIAAAIKEADGRRIADKEPVLNGGRLIDGFYKKITEPLDKAKRAIEAVLTVYQREKAAEERRQREAAEKAAREAAEAAEKAAAAQAAVMQTEADLDAAVEAERRAAQAAADAEKARREADAKAAELHHARGDYGAVASLRTEWASKIVDRTTLDLESLRSHLALDDLERALRLFVRAGGRSLRGAEIFERTYSVVR